MNSVLGCKKQPSCVFYTLDISDKLNYCFPSKSNLAKMPMNKNVYLHLISNNVYDAYFYRQTV